MRKSFPYHFCVLAYPQDQWEVKDVQHVLEKMQDSYLATNPNSTCNYCRTCPICRALWDFSDPENPDEYFVLCAYCRILLEYFKRFNQNKGKILFSHSYFEGGNLAKFVNKILESEKIKKIYVLFLERKTKKELTSSELLQSLTHKRLSLSDFLQTIESSQFSPSFFYEVFKDRYF